jgi:enamine deaminase RidA (YjgF/YER057c/UK114 family)
MSRSIVSTQQAPRLDAPLSQGVRKGSLLQVSGRLPRDADTGTVVGAG